MGGLQSPWKALKLSLQRSFSKRGPPPSDLTCMVVRMENDTESSVYETSSATTLDAMEPPPRSSSRVSHTDASKPDSGQSENASTILDAEPCLALTLYQNPIWKTPGPSAETKPDPGGAPPAKPNQSTESVAQFPQVGPAAKSSPDPDFHLTHTGLLSGLNPYRNVATSTVLRHVILDAATRRSKTSPSAGGSPTKGRIRRLPSRIWRSFSRKKKATKPPQKARAEPMTPPQEHPTSPCITVQPENPAGSQTEESLYSRVASMAHDLDFDENNIGSLIMILGEDNAISVD